MKSFLLSWLLLHPSPVVWSNEIVSLQCEANEVTKKIYGNLVGNSGCFILENNKILVVENDLHQGKLSPPGGTYKKDESALCTASRQAFEEAGVAVIVHELIHNFNNKFFLFRCELKDKSFAKLEKLPVPKLQATDNSKAYWLDLRKSKASKWRFPSQFIIFDAIFRNAVSSDSSKP